MQAERKEVLAAYAQDFALRSVNFSQQQQLVQETMRGIGYWGAQNSEIRV